MRTYHCEVCNENREPLDLFIKHEENGAIGLYCKICKNWIRWITKEEEEEILNAMLEAKSNIEPDYIDQVMRPATIEERESIEKNIEEISKPTGENFNRDETVIERLTDLSNYLSAILESELNTLATSPEDAVRKGAKTIAYQEMQKYVDNIIAGRVFTDDAK